MDAVSPGCAFGLRIVPGVKLAAVKPRMVQSAANRLMSNGKVPLRRPISADVLNPNEVNPGELVTLNDLFASLGNERSGAGDVHAGFYRVGFRSGQAII